MSNFTFSLISLAVGAAIGAFATYLVQKSKYENKLEEEMAEYRQSRNEAERRRREKAKAKEKDASDIFDALTEDNKKTMQLIISEAIEKRKIKNDDDEFDFDNEDEFRKAAESIRTYAAKEDMGEPDDDHEEDYEYSEPIPEEQMLWAKKKIENGDYTEEEMAEELGVSRLRLRELLENYEAELAKREYQAVASGYSTSNEPYNIDEEEYEDGEPTYNKELLLYYRGDGTIIFEESEEQMLEIGMCLGNIKKTLRNDRENSDGFIYVRNNTYKTDYKILCINENFFDEA